MHEKGRTQPRNQGLTLIETLVAIGAVVALAGVVSPLLLSARNRASDAAELSELHQLAVAQGLYTADTLGMPTSTLPLVSGGYVRAALCVSPVDTTVGGFANELDKELGQNSEIYQTLVLPYRSSYVGMREFNFPYQWVTKYLKGAPGAGWLVSLTTSKRQEPEKAATWYTGTYRRVMLDGSVQTRTHEPVQIDGLANHQNAEHGFFLFGDRSIEWKRKFISGSH